LVVCPWPSFPECLQDLKSGRRRANCVRGIVNSAAIECITGGLGFTEASPGESGVLALKPETTDHGTTNTKKNKIERRF
jgi:hypothetical protein